MCRLSVITATNFTNVEVAKLIQLSMIASQASDSQNKDGWGIASSWGQFIKNSGGFMQSDQEWIKHITASPYRYAPVLAHLRNSSAGTSTTVKEAQPFAYEINDALSFVAMHNGKVDGSYNKWRSWQTGDPNSDSWRAFSRLNQMMIEAQSTSITAELITEWLNAYDDTSAYVFVLASQDNVYVVKNNMRDLFGMTCGNGFLLMTSADAVRFVRNSAPLYGISEDAFPNKDPFTFISDRLYCIRAGTPIIEYETLQLEMKKGTRVWQNTSNFRNYGGGWDSQSYSQTAAQTGTQTTETTETQTTQSDEIERVELPGGAILLRPRQNTLPIIDGDDEDEEAWIELFNRGQEVLDNGRIDEIIKQHGGGNVSPRAILEQLEEEDAERLRSQAIREIKTLLNPIRDTLLAMYMDMFELGLFRGGNYELSDSFAIVTRLDDIPDKQIFQFLAHLKAHPEEHPTDKQARAVLNRWNHAVPQSKEFIAVSQFFGIHLPITVPADVALGIIQTIPAYAA